MPKRKIKIRLEGDNRPARSKSSMAASVRGRNNKNARYLATLEPSAGGYPIGGNLRTSKQSRDELGLEARIDYMDLDSQFKYYQD